MADPIDEQELEQARLNHAAGVLHAWVQDFIQRRGGNISRNDMGEIKDAIALHTSECRNQGVPFPDMVAILFPHAGHLGIARADLDSDNVARWAVEQMRGNPKITAAEMAEAIGAVWPGYNRDIINEAAKITRH